MHQVLFCFEKEATTNIDYIETADKKPVTHSTSLFFHSTSILCFPIGHRWPRIQFTQFTEYLR